MALIAFYWSVMILSYIIASKCRKHKEKFKWLDPILTFFIIFLVFVMGLRMGSNDEVIANLGTIGLQSLFMTIALIAGAVVAVTLTRKMLNIDKHGRLRTVSHTNQRNASKACSGFAAEVTGDAVDLPGGESVAGLSEGIQELEEIEEEESSNSSLMTWLIVIFTAVGLMAGYFFVDKVFTDMEFFDTLSSNAMVAGLSIMLAIIGFTMGLEGTIIKNFAKVGFRVFAFPLAVIISTVVVAFLCSLVLPLSVKESLAISFGFGWYTFAPIAIANEGYAIAGAISFMHNVIRETAGIVLIPLLAKKIGYIEVTAIPGVAAMDICMPIVEKATRQDIIVYSFLIGLVDCLCVPIFVPLFIGL